MNVALQALLREAEAHDGFPAVSDQAQLEARTGSREVFTRGEPELTAVGIVGAGELDLVVHPLARGRGLGTELFRELIEHARAQATRTGDSTGKEVRVWQHGENPAAVHLLTSHGFTPVRTLLRLELPGTALATVPDPTFDSGVTLRTFDVTNEAEARDFIAVNARAFADHPEQGLLTLEAFRETMREAWFDSADLLLAYEGDTLLAFSWIKTTTNAQGARETELYVIGVDPAASGRGLGTNLLRATMQRMATHSPARVTLYVEGDNKPALALYRQALFTTALRSQQWLRAFPA